MAQSTGRRTASPRPPRALLPAIIVMAAAALGIGWLLIAGSDDAAACPASAECVTVHTADGDYVFTAEWAIEIDEMTCGLMFRDEMDADHGMVFDYRSERPGIAFWMRNTLIPLDMVFIRADGSVSNIAERTTPLSLESVPAAGPVRYVLELVGGTADRIGLVAGDHVDLARAQGRTAGTAICATP